jgi:transcriptional regulator with XRE-family HTH domain
LSINVLQKRFYLIAASAPLQSDKQDVCLQKVNTLMNKHHIAPTKRMKEKPAMVGLIVDTDVEYFLRKFRDLNLSQRGVARRLNMHFSTLHRTINGKRNVKAPEATALANLFGVPVEEIISHLGGGDMVKSGQAPIMYVIRNGRLDALTRRPFAKVRAPEEGLIAFEDKDRGEVYFGRLPESGVNPTALGRLAIVKLDDDTMVAGKITFHKPSGLYEITLANGEVLERVSAQAAQAVDWIMP